MTAIEWSMWIGLALLGFAGSAMYSGMETGCYRLNRVRLHLRAQRGQRAAVVLQDETEDLSRLLSTLLIGNNVTNQLGTTAMGVIVLSLVSTELAAVALNALVVTPILFVVGETLPKDFFSAHADRLMYRLGGVLRWSRRVFFYSGLVPAVGVTWMVLGRLFGEGGKYEATHPRRHMQYLFKEGIGYGLLTEQQSDLVDRVMKLTDQTLADAMTPWGRALKVRVNDPPGVMWRLAEQGGGRSRYPVVDARGKVLGVVNVLDALVHEPGECPPIAELMVGAVQLPQTMGLRAGLTALQREGGSLAVVTDERGRPVGVASPKDLVEPITGELAQW
ncbi:MAG: CNNM domain-containing protein [Planctomycetota bacterium]